MNLQKTNNAIDKVQELQRKLYCSAKESKSRRFHAIYDKIYIDDVLLKAWKRVKSNGGSAGIDNKTIKYIEESGLEEFLNEIKTELKDGKYVPKPVKRVELLKDNGKIRPLGIPIVKDRVIQAATKIMIEPIFEADFYDEPYGFRPKRNQHQALESIKKACNNKGNWVLDADIEGYFDNINHEKLMKLVELRINDKRILRLIRKWLKAGVMKDGTFHDSEIGSPQGGVISPLLANIYLNYLDYIWTLNFKKFGKLIRLGDDFVIISKSFEDIKMAKQAILYIMNKLELNLSKSKTKIISLWQGKQSFDFLGYTKRKTKAKTIRGQVYYPLIQYISNKSRRKIKEKVKNALTTNTLYEDLEDKINELNLKAVAWKNYYKRTPYHRLIQIDKYIVFRLVILYNPKRKCKKRYDYIPLVKRMRKMGLKYLCY